MPKIEDLERLGSVALLIGNKKLPEELSKNDYDAFKSVFTNEYMENSKPTEDNDLPSIDEIDNLLSNDEDNIIKDNDIDDLGLPNDLGLEEGDKILSNLDDLGLPDNLGEEKEDEKISSDINDLNLEENNLEESDSNKLPILDDLPLPDNLPDTKNSNNTNDKNISNDLGISDISHLSDSGNFDNNVIEETLEENDNDIEENDFNEDNENLEEILDNDNLKIEEAEEFKDRDIEDNIIEDNLIKEDISEENILDNEEESKIESEKEKEDEKIETKSEEDINLDDLENILDDDDLKFEDNKEIEKSENKIEEDDSHLEDLEGILEDEEEESKLKEPEKIEDKAEEDATHLDNLEGILDDIEEESKIESDKEKEDEKIETKSEEEDINLDDLENILDEEDTKIPEETENYKEPEKTEDKITKDETKEEIDDLPDLDSIEDTNEIKEEAPVQIMEGGTSLPSPDTADKLGASRYENVDDNIDHDKVIDSIKNLSPLTRYHVLDAILNEKLDQASMRELLEALDSEKSNEDITELINRDLGLSIKEYGKSAILELIPIPNSLKDYAHIIRVAAVFLILFVGIVLLSYQFVYKPIKANEYFKKGLADIYKGAYNNAEINFAQGNKLKPKQIKWFNRYGKAYIERERFDSALAKIEGALNIKPRDFDSRVLFGYYYRSKGEKQLSEEDYIKGEELYNDMLSYVSKKNQLKTVYDERGILMISRAKNLSQANYYDNAYNNYIQMINLFGDNVIARKRAMLIRIYQDNYKQVKALQEHINNLKSGYIDDDVYPKLARYLLNNNDFYGSRTLLEKILKKYPSNLEAIIGYADYQARLKHYEKARDILVNTALPMFENNPYRRGKEFVYNMLGQIYYNLGEFGNSINNFNAALEINKTYPDANYNLANLYFYQDKDYEKAKEHYQLAYDNLPPELRGDKLLYNLSWIYYLNNEFDRAFEGFNALFQKNPSNSVVSYALGNSLLHLDRANLANGFYRNALNQILSRREKLGRLEMRTESDFFLLSYLASIYNNMGVSYAYNSTIENNAQNEREAFKNFVLASEYFDQIRTSNIDLERMEKRTIILENNNIGVATYNVMAIQSKRNLKDAVMIDDYIPKDIYYVR
ncbi:tetratricopeptide repeat protein [Brachyspira aalborgi]|uniref:Tetratricopeptide repeat protein n=1 Tax=Brachyspira aalborgi TaxID=29522 RepID=A0A5C8FU39_9SPIR|nr:tetratricopeptide repeat protein [Brachyspira aalborgi]TXJ40817.1 tetratricopeptide repeat protein [Brachyspira aalborgi]TXJ53136.1 tetratricopeptide repeat protein [Brachyspira aalborgi]